MTGVEIFLLLAGCIFMAGSFFITEKLSPSELDKIAELSQAELKRIVDNEISNAGPRIEDAVDNQIDASSDMVQRALEKETNTKIMAISEYSDSVIEEMNKTHNEIMFLYSMLNDKHGELTGMVSDLQRLAADIRNLQETVVPALNHGAIAPGTAIPARGARTAAGQQTAPKAAQQTVGQTASLALAAESAAAVQEEEPQEIETAPTPSVEILMMDEEEALEEKDNHNQDILLLHKKGLSEVEIARRLSLGVGEVKLVIGLYRGEIDL